MAIDQAGPAEQSGCGCGSDHADHSDASAAVPVQLLSGPPEPAPAPPPVAPGDLDVRLLPHGQRHGIIFSRMNALGPDESFVIVNDHDPRPLRYQADALWPDTFDWTYLEAGPQVWRLEITRASDDDAG